MAAPLLMQVSDTLIDLMPFAGILLIITWLMMMWRSRRRRLAERETPLERVERYHQERGVRQDLESLMVEIEQLARRFSSQLDAKSVQLERLIREADDRLARLAEARGVAPDGGGEPPASSKSDAAPSPTEDDLTREVYRLADEGQPAAAIARQVGEHVGKVELILALRS